MSKSNIKSVAEFDFDYTPLSDPVVVRWLLENRQAVNSYLEFKTINENMIITYADLDDLIERSELSKGERSTIDLVMEGYAMTDIAECFGGQRQTYRIMYQRAVNKICQMSDRLWSQFSGDCPAKGKCY